LPENIANFKNSVLILTNPNVSLPASQKILTAVQSGIPLIIFLTDSSTQAEILSILDLGQLNTYKLKPPKNINFEFKEHRLFSAFPLDMFSVIESAEFKKIIAPANLDNIILSIDTPGQIRLPVLAERRYGNGDVFIWCSNLSTDYSDLSLTPAFLPLMHILVKYSSLHSDPDNYSKSDHIPMESNPIKIQNPQILTGVLSKELPPNWFVKYSTYFDKQASDLTYSATVSLKDSLLMLLLVLSSIEIIIANKRI